MFVPALSSAEQLRQWEQEQHALSNRIVAADDVPWRLSPSGSPTAASSPLFCGGADVSFRSPTLPDAVVTFVVVKLDASGRIDLVYSASRDVHITVPYASTYLAFRESPCLEGMYHALPHALRNNLSVVVTDGNGVLHPRRAGLACHFAIAAGGVPTIGVAKSLMCMDGLDEKAVRRACARLPKDRAHPLIGTSGIMYGNAVLTGNAVSKPLYVSVGHRVSLETATRLVAGGLCKYRVPEPIRVADSHSREALRGRPVHIPFDAEKHLGVKVYVDAV